ncbi:uncharacterized protein [Amphiura filiformis]|uniref:uncharacterized protein isoform X2 n=1 Tax=Amphiura filiformis TaxID=82378 RepID=UPI003B213C6F
MTMFHQKQYSCGVKTMSSGRVIDIRSDTFTKPTPEMYKAMMNAELGDDVYDGDPTAEKLQDTVAKMMKKEAALFVPTGTMGNLVSIMAHCQGRGEEVLLGEECHILVWEQAGISQIANVNARAVKTSPDGKLCLKDLEAKIRWRSDPHWPITRLICLENTFSGRVLPLDYLKQVRELADKYNVKIHLDGARLMNAVVALGTTPDAVVQYCDSVSMCFSKGLGCPVGSIVAGDKDFIARALRHRKVLGGGMRQSGILAAAALVALDKSVARLHVDHDNAKKLAKGLVDMKSSVFTADPQAVETNMVIIQIQDGTNPMTVCQLLATRHEGEEAALGQPVHMKIFPFNGSSLRGTFHQDVSTDDVDWILKKLKFVSDLLSSSKGRLSLMV